MSFVAAQAAIQARYTEVNQYVARLVSSERGLLSGDASISRDIFVLSKGFSFVYIYAYLEFSFRRIISDVFDQLSDKAYRFCDLDQKMLALALDPELTSLSSQKSASWPHRTTLFAKASSADPVRFNTSCFSSMMQNIGPRVIANIGAAFGLAGPHTPSESHVGRLADTKQKRNDVAHGNESPIVLGQSVSVAQIEEALRFMDEQVKYSFAQFSDLCVDKKFLRSSLV